MDKGFQQLIEVIKQFGGSTDIGFQKMGPCGKEGAPTRYGRNLDGEFVIIDAKVGMLTVSTDQMRLDVATHYPALKEAGAVLNDADDSSS